MNPINQELRELRMVKEHYLRVLRTDELIVKGEVDDDGRPRLSEGDVLRIRAKIDGIDVRIGELLVEDTDNF